MKITALAKIEHCKARSTCPADPSYRPFTGDTIPQKSSFASYMHRRIVSNHSGYFEHLSGLIRVLLSGKQFVRSDLKMALKRTKVCHDNTETTEDITCSSSAQEVGVQDFKRYVGHFSPKLVSARHP